MAPKKAEKDITLVKNTIEKKGLAKLIRKQNNNSKEQKLEADVEAGTNSRQKLLEVMERQLKTRKEKNDSLLKNLSQVIKMSDEDANAIMESKKKLKNLCVEVGNSVQRTTVSFKQTVQDVKDILDSFKKQCEEIEVGDNATNDKFVEELEDDINKLQQKLISETKKSGLETLQKTIFHAMHNYF